MKNIFKKRFNKKSFFCITRNTLALGIDEQDQHSSNNDCKIIITFFKSLTSQGKGGPKFLDIFIAQLWLLPRTSIPRNTLERCIRGQYDPIIAHESTKWGLFFERSIYQSGLCERHWFTLPSSSTY